MRLWSVGKARGAATTVLGKLIAAPCPLDCRADAIPYGSCESLASFGGDWQGYAGVLCSDPVLIEPAPPLPAVQVHPSSRRS